MGVLLELLVLALIAAFVLYRLYSALGTRSGTEKKRPNPFASPDNNTSSQESSFTNVVDLKTRKPRRFGFLKTTPDIIDVDFETKEFGVQGGQEVLSRIKKIEPTFSVTDFLKGSKSAFDFILQSYAKGDKKSLKPLLAGDVLDAFTKGINAREKDKTTLTIQVQSLTAEIIDATLHDKTKTAEITVQFSSDQLHTLVKSSNNEEKSSSQNQEVLVLTDIWTFARTLQDPNPNWVLVKTASKPQDVSSS